MGAVLITGANRGIGLEFVRQYAAEGWTVIAACRAPDQAKDLNKIAKNSKTVSVVALDVTKQSDIDAAAKAVGVPIDVLINNAGILTGKAGVSVETGNDDLASCNTEDWLKIFHANTVAPTLITRAFLPQLKKSKKPVVAMISSGWGQIGALSDGDSFMPYKTSKAALNMAMKCMSQALIGDRITLVSFRPGWVRTDMGGPHASIGVEESVDGMKKVIAGLTIDDTGAFLDYSGKTIPW